MWNDFGLCNSISILFTLTWYTECLWWQYKWMQLYRLIHQHFDQTSIDNRFPRHLSFLLSLIVFFIFCLHICITGYCLLNRRFKLWFFLFDDDSTLNTFRKYFSLFDLLVFLSHKFVAKRFTDFFFLTTKTIRFEQ